MKTKNVTAKRNNGIADKIAQAAGYKDHIDAVAHLGTRCACPWSMQAGCRYSDGTGAPNDPYILSGCTAPKTHRCEYRRKGEEKVVKEPEEKKVELPEIAKGTP